VSRRREGAAPFPIPDEGGTALILALSLLFALSALSLLGFVAAHTDLLVAGHRKKEREMFFAEEAVLHIAVDAINDPVDPAVTVEDLASASAAFSTGVREGTFDHWKYFWRASFLADEQDRDRNPATETVLFNRAFGYGGSPFATGGHPVVRIDVAVEQGTRRGALTAGMTHIAVAPVIEAAWTAAGPLLLEGRVVVSGLDHDGEGRVLAGDEGDLPGIHAGGTVSLGAGVAVAGAAGEAAVVGHCGMPGGDPLAFLDPGDTLSRLEEIPAAPAEGEPLSGMVFSPEDISGSLQGQGLVVVHNPRYDPLRHEASRLAMEEGVFLPGYDPAYSHLDSSRQPATLEIVSGGNFRGIVVADTLGPVFEKTRIIGALVTLTREPLSLRADAALEVLYSRDAAAAAGRGDLACRLFFKSLPGTAERFAAMARSSAAAP
jgi:hypothetical protein